jgi:hypothetical protein
MCSALVHRFSSVLTNPWLPRGESSAIASSTGFHCDSANRPYYRIRPDRGLPVQNNANSNGNGKTFSRSRAQERCQSRAESKCTSSDDDQVNFLKVQDTSS